ncbi:MAG TPA: sigma-54 dependent transcriptional regulator [Candidatus Acidoferrales bacterium]|nr:sigma-54 dependent transcriptional regulator [Candidatus Acidoferrales bacterium]
MPAEKVLIVDDEKLVRWSLRQKCEEWGFHVLEADHGAAALRLAQNETPDLLLLDVRLPDMNGIAVLEQMKAANSAPRAVIMITADPQLEDVKHALKLGAYDFVGKPLNFDELSVTVKNALEATRLRAENETLRGEVRRRTGYHEVVGVSQRMTELMAFVNKVAASEATTILVQGESGTGKDLIAKAIHYQSNRQNSPFVAINCSAIPETLMEAELFGHERGAFTDAKTMKKGLFEVADGGTLFLDEIGELSPLLQAKLLRVLEDQVIRRVGGVRDMQVDVRVIAASNRDLERAVREAQFRQDLYYRLAIISVFLPPLRERKEDIFPLVDYFIERYNRKFRKSVQGITEPTRKLLMKHDWPGNVRELKNAIERAMILEDEEFLRPDYLPFSVGAHSTPFTAFELTSMGTSAPSFTSNKASSASPMSGGQLSNGRSLPRLSIPEGGTSLEEVERALVDMALQQANGNQTQAARLLDISRDALRYKLKKFGLMHAEEGDEVSSEQ